MSEKEKTGKRITIKVSDDLHRGAVERAAAEHRSLAKHIVHLLECDVKAAKSKK